MFSYTKIQPTFQHSLCNPAKSKCKIQNAANPGSAHHNTVTK